EHLDPRARTMWYVSEGLEMAVWTVVVVAIAVALTRFTDVSTTWTWVVAAVILIGSLIDTIVSPGLRYRSWRYEIRADEVDLQHGVIVKTRQLVPMSRIQHVDTRRGVLQRRFGLASVVFYTAAGAMEIPALSLPMAAEVRNRIAELAKVHDDL
ncbi:MAG TPA: PH domain-containing protein, partial [Thermomicrobiales bacterium]|nr:PH domain-containing protein [Thermomicrobiales bacterium]